jgi:hypothetical protein
MFNKSPIKPSQLDKTIEELLTDMQTTKGDSDEYAKMVDHLTKLYKLKEIDLPKRVSAETWATIGGNLAGILLILHYERFNVITSKALSFVSKIR